MSLTDFIAKLKIGHLNSPPDTIDRKKEEVLFYILLITSAAGIFAYISSVIGAYYIGYIDTIIIDTIVYVLLLHLLFSKRLNYKQRVYIFLGTLWFLSLYLIFKFDIFGAGFFWFFVVPILTVVFLGLREGIAVFLSGLLIVWIGYAFFSPISQSDPIIFSEENRTYFRLIILGNLITLAILLIIPVSMVIGAMKDFIAKLKRQLIILAQTKDVTIETIAKLAELKDKGTGAHIERTKAYVKALAKQLQKNEKYREILSDAYIERLYKSSPLHDIGKVGIPDAILLKKESLTPDEMRVMQSHTVIGRDALLASADKLEDASFLELAAEIAYSHQERWDGSGYPEGLKGEQIPLSGRIMAVADVYDALRSKRSYKEAMSHEEAKRYLVENSGKLFDPDVIEAFLEAEQEFKKIAQQYDE